MASIPTALSAQRRLPTVEAEMEELLLTKSNLASRSNRVLRSSGARDPGLVLLYEPEFEG